MRVAMIGSGYVGLVSGACFADFGHHVTCVDKDATKIARLRDGEIPIFEPDLDRLVAVNVREKRLDFTTDLPGPVAEAGLHLSRSSGGRALNSIVCLPRVAPPTSPKEEPVRTPVSLAAVASAIFTSIVALPHETHAMTFTSPAGLLERDRGCATGPVGIRTPSEHGFDQLV